MSELLNIQYNQPAWTFRRIDCSYMISLILRELNETFQQQQTNNDGKRLDEGSFKDPLFFSNWLLNSFPFDNKMRLACLQLDCVNHRLNYMYNLLTQFININCKVCNEFICTKSDVFSMSKQGFMQAYLNPGGYVHETLTVYKVKGVSLMGDPPSTLHSWFPGNLTSIVVVVDFSFILICFFFFRRLWLANMFVYPML
jgi:cereblon